MTDPMTPNDPNAQVLPDGNNQADQADSVQSGTSNFTFYSDEGALVRMTDPTAMPELFLPSSSQTWVRYPDFDQVHNGFPLDEQVAAQMAGGADVLNAPLDQSAPGVTLDDSAEGGAGDGKEAPAAQAPPAKQEGGQAVGGPPADQGPGPAAKQTG